MSTVFVPHREIAVTRPRALSAPVLLGGVLTASVIFFNEAVFRSNDVEQFSADWQVMLRLLICGACGLYGFYFLPQTLGAILRFPGVLSLGLGFWAMATVPFAIDAKYSAASVAALWCILLFAPAALQQLGPQRMLVVSLFALGAFLCGSWWVYLFVPELGRTVQMIAGGEVIERFGGLTHSNGMGRQTALFLALLLLAAVEYRWSWWCVLPLAAIAVLTIELTDSRTAMIAAALGMLVALRTKLKWTLRPAVLCSAIAVGAALWGLLFAADLVSIDPDNALGQLSRSGEAEEIYSLTGRTDVWRFVIGNIAQSPLVGFGYGCSRFVMVHNFFATHHAHNLLLNVGLGAGLPASLLVAWMLVVLLWRALASPAGFPDVIAVMVLVGGVADYMMLGPIPDSHTLLFFVALYWRELSPARPLLDGASSTTPLPGTAS